MSYLGTQRGLRQRWKRPPPISSADETAPAVRAIDVLAEGGLLSQHLPGFAPRDGQIELADTVALALEEGGVLVAEAGTGIGKTFGYLAPALLSGRKCIVSTGTKHLQDQLFKKDLPTLQRALKLDYTAVLLKGRANYLCIYRLGKALDDTRKGNFEDFAHLKRIDEWGVHTHTGDRVEYTELPEDHRIWPKVTSTTDNCLGQECPDYKNCFVVKARRAALEADMVVINHHLFCADLSLKDTGFGELLPECDAIILDEAHQLPEIATRFFGRSVSSRQLIDLCQEIVIETRREGDMPDLDEIANKLPADVHRLRMSMGAADMRGAWQPLLREPEVSQALDTLDTNVRLLVEALEMFAERSVSLQTCFKRALGHMEMLVRLKQPEKGYIHWFETSRTGFMLRATPLEIATTFQNYMYALSTAWVFTSATLAVGDNFDHFTERLGLEKPLTRQWHSPFDYAANALLYLPSRMPLPHEPRFCAEAVQRAVPLINANPGGTFFLFTSYRAMQEAASLIRTEVDCHILVQGDAPRQQLIDEFRQSGKSLLLATSSFWEGVDVRGTALSLVIIDKLPFASPGDPVLEARLNAMRDGGGNPFMDYQLPQAVIALKQGAGRLIRDMTDKGVLAILDPRLQTKAYGRQFLASIPAMPLTSDEAEAMRFLRRLALEDNPL